MSEHMETFHCRECGGVQFYWHFEGPDGDSLIAKLAVLPDMTSMEAAKAKALADHERRKGSQP